MITHAEMSKKEIDTNPCSGESKFGITLDLYVFPSCPDEVVVWGWGTHDVIRGKSILDVVSALEADGFSWVA